MVEIAVALAMLLALLLGGGEVPASSHTHFEDHSGFGELRSRSVAVSYFSGAMDSPGDILRIEVVKR